MNEEHGGKPAVILTVSAHCKEDCATLTVGPHIDLIYDYYGFPA